MRRLALLFAIFAVLVASTGCCWNWSDPVHPRVCPVVPKCEPSGGCDSYYHAGNYP